MRFSNRLSETNAKIPPVVPDLPQEQLTFSASSPDCPPSWNPKALSSFSMAYPGPWDPPPSPPQHPPLHAEAEGELFLHKTSNCKYFLKMYKTKQNTVLDKKKTKKRASERLRERARDCESERGRAVPEQLLQYALRNLFTGR